MLIGIVGFAAASAIGGAATSYGMLIVARATQGAFGALLAPAALAALTTTFTDPSERGKAFGIYGAVAGAGGGVGLLLGGVLTEWVSWRWCLYVNVPIAIVAVIGVTALLSRESLSRHVKLDLPGTLLVTAGLVGVVYGFSHADTAGWSDPLTLALLFGGLALLAVFAAWERRAAHPLLPLRVVLDRNRGGSYVAFSLAGAGMFAVFLFLTYFFARTLGYSPVKTGVAFLPMVGTVLVTASVATQLLVTRFGTRVTMTAGMVLAAVGMALLTRVGVHSGYASHVLPGLLVAAAGIGLVFAPGMQAATAGVHAEDAGVASAMMNVTQQVGGSLGTALLNTIATTAAASFVAGKVLTPEVAAQSAVHSYVVTFWWAAAIFAVGAVLTALLLTKQEEPALLPDDGVGDAVAFEMTGEKPDADGSGLEPVATRGSERDRRRQ